MVKFLDWNVSFIYKILLWYFLDEIFLDVGIACLVQFQ